MNADHKTPNPVESAVQYDQGTKEISKLTSNAISGYQKGVVPKYLRDRKEQGAKEVEGARADEENAACPPGHVTLPDNERKETLKMLRNSKYTTILAFFLSNL